MSWQCLSLRFLCRRHVAASSETYQSHAEHDATSRHREFAESLRATTFSAPPQPARRCRRRLVRAFLAMRDRQRSLLPPLPYARFLQRLVASSSAQQRPSPRRSAPAADIRRREGMRMPELQRGGELFARHASQTQHHHSRPLTSSVCSPPMPLPPFSSAASRLREAPFLRNEREMRSCAEAADVAYTDAAAPIF